MTQIDPNHTQAILIGASEFADEGFPNLPNVKINLLELNRLLIESLGIDKNQICMMLDWDYSNQITSKTIEIIPNALDTLIVYYAGHGIFRSADFYLATKKTQPKEPEYSGAIPSKQLVDLVIKKAKAKNIIFIIDCCFSARAKEGVDSRGKQVFFITAAPSTQPAKDESPENANYTAFTHELLVILKEGIENSGEILSLQEIFNCLEQRLKSKNLPSPQIGGHGSADKLGICKNMAKKNDQDTSLVLSGKNKILFCRRLGESWEDLANYFDIPSYERHFKPGRECQAILVWLENRNRIQELFEALKFIRRDELLSVFQPSTSPN